MNQRTAVWCWLAVAEMVISYRNWGSPTQCRMMEIGYNVPPGTCCGREQACARTATGMGELMAVIGAFGNIPTQWSPPGDPMALYRTLRQDKPVIAQIRSGSMSTHVVVIRGMRFQTMQVGFYPNGMPIMQVIPMVLINDPLGILPQDMPYAQLAQVWIDALIVGTGVRRTPPAAAPPPPPPPRDPDDDDDHAAPPRPVSDFCAAVRRVLASGRSKATIRGQRHRRDPASDATSYDGRVNIPGTQGCTVWVADDREQRPYYRCAILTEEESDCADVEERAIVIGAQVRACLPDWEFLEKDKRKTYDYGISGRRFDRDDTPLVSSYVFQFDRPEQHCTASFTME